MNWLVKKIDLKTLEINFLLLTILLYLFRTTIPILKFPFILFFSGLMIYFFFNYFFNILDTFKNFFRIFYLGICLTIILIASFLLSNKLYLLIFKDCLNAIIQVSLFFLMTFCITSKSDLNAFIKNLVRYVFFFALIISSRLLSNDLNIFPVSSDLSSDKSTLISLIGSVSSEYNLNLIPVLLGLICTMYFLPEAKNLIQKVFLNLILIIHSLTILFSGSRRGLIVLGVIFIVFIYLKLVSLSRNKSKLKKAVSRFFVFLASVFLLVFLFQWFFFKSSFYQRNTNTDFTASKNTNSVKTTIAFAIYRYLSIFENEVSYEDIKNKIGVTSYDKAMDGDITLGSDTSKIERNRKYQDPVRKWAARLIQEDTTYFKYKSNLDIHNISNSFFGNRVMRLQFSMQIFLKEFNWRQKNFGGGFNFLNWFGYRFLNDKSFSDYPHNPFFSVLLYSGLFGLLIYSLFMFRVISYYFKYFRVYPILSIFFLITFIFSFFSGNSPFDPPIMGFLALLPFFIHHIHNRSEHV